MSEQDRIRRGGGVGDCRFSTGGLPAPILQFGKCITKECYDQIFMTYDRFVEGIAPNFQVGGHDEGGGGYSIRWSFPGMKTGDRG